MKKRPLERRLTGRLCMLASLQILAGYGNGPGELMDRTICILSSRGLAGAMPRAMKTGEEFCVRLPDKMGPAK